MGIKRALIRVGSFTFQGVIGFVLFALANEQTHPADILTAIVLGVSLIMGSACALNLALKDLDAELKSGDDI
jgi:heme O synthase-like polyprenyltransferase